MVSILVNIPGYQVSEELYNGSRTLVYRGYRETDSLPVVIKLLKNPYPSFSELMQFRNQYTIAKNLNSPLIVQTYSIDVIPSLERIIGKQPPAIELSASAAQNRFNLLIQKFVQVFTSREHPLVIFLDDLQWADSASLKLLQLLMEGTGYLFILGAYRDNEISPTHPFILTVDEIVKTGAVVNTITLRSLSFVDMNQLVADTLNCELSLAQPLTELVVQKTKGNPFFATQFLKALYEDGRITFDLPESHASCYPAGTLRANKSAEPPNALAPLSNGAKQRGWQCDIAEIRALALTDDVVEFMALQLQKLPKQTQNVLKLAACIGAQFDLNTLAIKN